MKFPALRRHWERLGRNDPYWAVLTDPAKRRDGWDIDEFFRSGVDEIDDVLQRAAGLGLTVSRGRALDFGCGVGRLTQAMAAHFTRCDGVDISESMLKIARQHNSSPDRCLFHLNAASDLALFDDRSFDFVYTALVLQHMEPRYSKSYMREFLRVLAPGGLLVFQVPSQRSTQEAPAGARQSRVGGPLPSGAFRARLTVEPQSMSAGPGEQAPLEVTVENTSPFTWPSLPSARGDDQITAGNRWLYEDGELLQRDDARCPLPFDVAPGVRASVMLVVTTPPEDGLYLLELDLVQENVAWFAEYGSPTVRLPFVVGTGRGAPRPPKKAREHVEPAPFRFRHPRAFRIMRATGIRDAYWVWRRALDRVNRTRDHIIIGVRERLRLTRYFNALVTWWRRGFSARMEMHWVPRADVVALMEEAGGRVVRVEEEWTPGYQSCRYWVCRDR